MQSTCHSLYSLLQCPRVPFDQSGQTPLWWLMMPAVCTPSRTRTPSRPLTPRPLNQEQSRTLGAAQVRARQKRGEIPPPGVTPRQWKVEKATANEPFAVDWLESRLKSREGREVRVTDVNGRPLNSGQSLTNRLLLVVTNDGHASALRLVKSIEDLVQAGQPEASIKTHDWTFPPGFTVDGKGSFSQLRELVKSPEVPDAIFRLAKALDELSAFLRTRLHWWPGIDGNGWDYSVREYLVLAQIQLGSGQGSPLKSQGEKLLKECQSAYELQKMTEHQLFQTVVGFALTELTSSSTRAAIVPATSDAVEAALNSVKDPDLLAQLRRQAVLVKAT